MPFILYSSGFFEFFQWLYIIFVQQILNIICSMLFYYKIEEKYRFPARATLCVNLACPPGLCGFSPLTPVSSHIPKMCTWGELGCLSCPSVCVCARVVEEYPVQHGSCLTPWYARMGSGHSWPWTGISLLENNYLTCFC